MVNLGLALILGSTNPFYKQLFNNSMTDKWIFFCQMQVIAVFYCSNLIVNCFTLTLCVILKLEKIAMHSAKSHPSYVVVKEVNDVSFDVSAISIYTHKSLPQSLLVWAGLLYYFMYWALSYSRLTKTFDPRIKMFEAHVFVTWRWLSFENTFTRSGFGMSIGRSFYMKSMEPP